jgi:lysozyme
MQLSGKGLELIKQWEGFRARAYKDVAGNVTIGYGHKVRPPETFPRGVTESGATELLLNDVSRAEQAIAKIVEVPLTQGQFDALVDFCYNVGAGRLATSTLLRELNAGKYEEAGRQLLLWDEAGGEVYTGLLARREAELALWRGVEPAAKKPPATATPHPPVLPSAASGA